MNDDTLQMTGTGSIPVFAIK